VVAIAPVQLDFVQWESEAIGRILNVTLDVSLVTFNFGFITLSSITESYGRERELVGCLAEESR
jgi:hypothetical protein